MHRHGGIQNSSILPPPLIGISSFLPFVHCLNGTTYYVIFHRIWVIAIFTSHHISINLYIIFTLVIQFISDQRLLSIHLSISNYHIGLSSMAGERSIRHDRAPLGRDLIFKAYNYQDRDAQFDNQRFNQDFVFCLGIKEK